MAITNLVAARSDCKSVLTLTNYVSAPTHQLICMTFGGASNAQNLAALLT